MKTCKMSVSLRPLEVFLRKIKPLNQASSGMHRSSVSSGCFPSVTGWLYRAGVDCAGLSVYGRFVCQRGEFGVVLENLLLQVYFHLAVQLHNFPLQ